MTERSKHKDESEVRGLLPHDRTLPAVLASSHSLPFGNLGEDEFEVLCWLLYKRENPEKHVVLFGKTSDRGRDTAILDDGHIIQCKRYSKNVGVGAIREELAKLCAHSHAGAIDDPKTVTFVVSSDLTSPALDFLSSPDDFRDDVETLLSDCLGDEPSDGLMEFASNWWPILAHENGISLTQRLRKFPDLVEEFFAMQKVVTGDLAQVMPKLADLEEALNQLRLSASAGESAPAALRDFLSTAEENNPGCLVRARSTKDQTIFEIIPSEGVPVEFGNLSFPDSDAGRRGAEKLLKMLDYGYSAELEPGEFAWESSLNAPLPEGVLSDDGRLVLHSQPPPEALPVRLEVLDGDQVVKTVEYTKLTVLRAGRREIEVEIGGFRFAGKLRLTLSMPPTDKGNAHLNLNLSGYSVVDALRTVEWLEALAHGHRMRVWSLTHDDAFIARAKLGLPFQPDDFIGSVGTLEDLAEINRVFGLDLRYPEVVDAETGQLIERIGAAIRLGKFAEAVPNFLVFNVPVDEAWRFVSWWEEHGPVTITADATAAYELLGEKIDLGELKLHALKSFPARGIDDVRELLENARDEIVPVIVSAEQLQYEFERYVDDQGADSPCI